MSYSAILFDLDGTLTDSGPGIKNAVSYALRALGYPVPDREALSTFIGPPLTAEFRRFCGMDQATSEEATRLFRVYYHETGVYENAPYPGAAACLAALRDAGKSLAVATSKPQQLAELVLQHFDLARYFTAICGASMDESHNRKPEIVADALRALRVTDPRTAILVGDRFHDIAGAQANGIDSLGVLHGYGSRAELEEAGATLICRDFSGVQAALLGENAASPRPRIPVTENAESHPTRKEEEPCAKQPPARSWAREASKS